jgi:hypothetical protein
MHFFDFNSKERYTVVDCQPGVSTGAIRPELLIDSVIQLIEFIQFPKLELLVVCQKS